MKRLICIMLCCAMMTAASVSCGDDSEDSGSDSKAPGYMNNDDDDEEAAQQLAGYWEIPDSSSEGLESVGLMFNEDGTGGIYEVFDDLIEVTDNTFKVGGQKISKSMIDFDGSKFVIKDGDDLMMDMTRIGGKDDSTYVGKYRLTGGELYDVIVDGMETDMNIEDSSPNLTIEFKDNNTIFVFEDVIAYKLTGNNIVLSGQLGKLWGTDMQDKPLKWEIKGSKLTFYTEDGNEMVLKRADI